MKRLSPTHTLLLVAVGFGAIAMVNPSGDGDWRMVLFLIAIVAAIAAMVSWTFAPVSGASVEPNDANGAVQEAGETESEGTTNRDRFSTEDLGRALARHRKPLLAALALLVIFVVYRSRNGADQRERQAESIRERARQRRFSSADHSRDAD